MESDNYLPTGAIVGGHYEIVDVLGEDAFDILYLVRDNHRRGSFFVLKELFLETFSSRRGESVYTIPEAKGVFEKRKQEIIKEVNQSKRVRQRDDEVKTYGYIEDNNTIYTIMEFTNNSDLTNYLQFHPKDEIILPSLEELTAKPKSDKKKSSIFLKILIVTVIIGIALALYANKMIKEDREKSENRPKVVVTQTPIHHPPLKSRESDDDAQLQEKTTQKSNEQKSETSLDNSNEKTYISVDESTLYSKEETTDNIKEDGIYIDNEIEEIIDEKEIINRDGSSMVTKVEEQIKQNISLGKPIGISLGSKIEPHQTEPFTRASIQHFLDGFIAVSEKGSLDDIVSKYDYHVDRYFSLHNVTHSTIKRDKQRYNRKWTHRSFKIEDFKILKIYKHDGTEYCDIQTITRWQVSTESGKSASGISRGLMTIKNTPQDFKVKSIQTIR